jgi:hypothetical protein
VSNLQIAYLAQSTGGRRTHTAPSPHPQSTRCRSRVRFPRTHKIATAQNAAGTKALSMPNATFDCPGIDLIAVFENRIDLRCNTVNTVGSDAVTYYAYSTDPAHATTANQFLAIGNTAFALSDPVILFYYDDPALNPPGCSAVECRGLMGISIIP